MAVERTAEYYDHQRDLRKHDWRPGDEPPLSVQLKTATTALETVCLIRAVDNDLAVELLEAYADAKAAAIRLEAVAAGAHP